MAVDPPNQRPPRPPRRDPLDDDLDLFEPEEADDDVDEHEPEGTDWDGGPADDSAADGGEDDDDNEPAPTPWDDDPDSDSPAEVWSDDAADDGAADDGDGFDWDAPDDHSGADEDLLALPPRAAAAPELLPILGACEMVLLPWLMGRLPLLAEVDSRRDVSVLRCPITADVATPTQLDLALGRSLTTVQAPLVDGVRRLRTVLALAGRRFEVDIELEPADGPPVILLGRDVLAGAFLIDVDQRFRLGRPA